MSDNVTAQLTNDTVSASIVVSASPAAVFDFVRRPANHPAISGDSTVKGTKAGPDVLTAESKFGMKMRMGPIPYRITNKVVEFDHDRLIAWAHFSGHRWRWAFEPVGDDTSVTLTYDQAPARAKFALRRAGYPKRHVDNVVSSLVNLSNQFNGD